MPVHSPATNYGGGRALPVHADLEDARADLASGLLIRIHLALLNMTEGQILRISSPLTEVTDQLRSFEAASGNALLSVMPDAARPGWSSHYLRKGGARTDWSDVTDAPDLISVATPDTARSIEQLMPTRLWLYTNYDCNLACDYCCVVAGPRADPRRLPAERIHALVDQAVASGMSEVFLTGGEPTLRPDLPELIEYVTDRLPLTLLTNAMLLRGPRWDRLRPLIAAGRPIAFQVSLDSATPERHDAHRGQGAHARALAGIRTLVEAGARVRLAASLPEAALDEIPELHLLADSLGIRADDRIFRPIALRGAASEGEPIRPEDVAPELTCDAQGWFWHPLSNDPDMRLDLPPDASMAAALEAVRGRLVEMISSHSARLDRFVCG
ncbi:MAG: radical SAM protein [Chloroflexi bacterium]|nr:radical SAM protein [Chloroflexota bacterium]